jgi:RES domain-containing protein
MLAWRLTRKLHADEPLDGEGARRYGGRWNHAGTAVVYTSQSLALAVLEYLVNLSIADLPPDLVSIKFNIPDRLSQTEINVKDLPANWRAYPAIEELKDAGDEWVASKSTAILSVPSVVIPHERNLIINPAHAQARLINVLAVARFTLDPRLYIVKTSPRKLSHKK